MTFSDIIGYFDVTRMFSDSLSAVSGICGICATVVALFIYSFRDRKKILVSKCIADVLWFWHYLFLGNAVSGAALNLVGAVRETVFYHKDKKWAKSVLWVVLFLCIAVGSTLLTWGGPISLLPMFGSCIAIVAIRLTKPLCIRLLCIPSITLWMIYSIITGSVPALICNIFSIISVLVGLVKDVSGTRRRK